jgi:hypothetical protein
MVLWKKDNWRGMYLQNISFVKEYYYLTYNGTVVDLTDENN